MYVAGLRTPKDCYGGSQCVRGDFYVFACSISVIILLRKTVLFDNEYGTVRYVFVMPRTSAHNLQYVWRRGTFHVVEGVPGKL